MFFRWQNSFTLDKLSHSLCLTFLVSCYHVTGVMTFCIIIIRNFNLSRFFSEFLCWDSIFYQKSLPIQLLLYPLEGGFVRAAEGVQVDAIGELGEDVGFVLGDGLQELAYVIAGAQLELSRQLALDRRLYDDVQDAAAVIDADVQLLRHLLHPAVLTDDAPHETLPLPCQDIALGGGGDVRTTGTEEGYISNDDLSADVKLFGQGGCADGLFFRL